MNQHSALRISTEELSFGSLAAPIEKSVIAANFTDTDASHSLTSFLIELNKHHKPYALLYSLFDLLKTYRLEFTIQLRLPGLEITISENGENAPHEVTVINHVRSKGRIFEFENHAAYNFEHLTILIDQRPLGDLKQRPRIRDNILIAAGCANAKLRFFHGKNDEVSLRQA